MSDATTAQSVRPLRHAATMIVLREVGGTLEVLMTRRHADLAFMGGMWVFPGGVLAPTDLTDAAHRLVDAERCSFPLRDINAAPLPRPTCIALAIAACRETFEETGVLLARRADEQPIEPTRLARLQSQRAAFAEDPSLFVDELRRESLRLDIDRMIYWAHWITPSGVPRRFDTRFFVCPAPERQEFVADSYETTECSWMTPHELLESARRGDMKIAQPTRYTLEDLRASIERHRTLHALLRAEAQRDVPPIMPKLTKQDGKTLIVMPWDENYAQAPGEGVAAGQHYDPTLIALASRVERDH